MKKLIKLIVVMVLIASISSCFFKKNTYQYVSEHCHNRYLDGDIYIYLKGKINKALIKTYTKKGTFAKQYIPKDEHNWWADTTFNIKILSLPRKSLSTEYDWEVVINDSLQYYITDFNFGIGYSCRNQDYHCYIKSCMITFNSVKVRNCNFPIYLNKED